MENETEVQNVDQAALEQELEKELAKSKGRFKHAKGRDAQKLDAENGVVSEDVADADDIVLIEPLKVLNRVDNDLVVQDSNVNNSQPTPDTFSYVVRPYSDFSDNMSLSDLLGTGALGGVHGDSFSVGGPRGIVSSSFSEADPILSGAFDDYRPESVQDIIIEPVEEDDDVEDVVEVVDSADSIEGAVAVTLGNRHQGEIEEEYDSDFYSVDLQVGVTYVITMRGYASLDGDLYDPYIFAVYDRDGVEVDGGDDDGLYYDDFGEDDYWESYESLLTYTPTYTGTHYIELGAYGDDYGTYTFGVTRFGIHFNGTSSDEVINGDANYSDHLEGNGGDDTIYGYDGDDFINGGYGDDVLYGGDGDDYLYADTGNDILRGEDGDDHLIGGGDDNILIGGDGSDVLFGWEGSDSFVIDSAVGVDTIADYSVAERDVIDLSGLVTGYVQGSSDVNDFVRFQASSDGALILVDSDGSLNGANFTAVARVSGYNDLEFRDGSVDLSNITLVGGSDSDALTSGAYALTLDTRVTADIDNSSFEDLDLYSITLTAGTAYAISVQGQSTGEGDSEVPEIFGIYDSNFNRVNDGDTEGGIGDDALLWFTPTSTETYYIDVGGTDGGYSIVVNQAGDYVTSGSSINGTANTDYLRGNNNYNGQDTINGLGGDDYLEGRGGNDVLNGGSGLDYLSGGANQDTFVIDNLDAVDVITDFSMTQSDKLDLSSLLTGYVQGSSDANDFIRLVNSGTSTLVMVDVDGTVNGVNFVSAVEILNHNNLNFRQDANEVDVSNIYLSSTTDADSQFSGANMISMDTSIDATIDGDDIDIYGVTLTAGVEYALSVRGSYSGFTLYDPEIHGVYDVDGNLVQAANYDLGLGKDELLFFTPSSTGTYYFDVGTYSNSTLTGEYSYQVDVTLAGTRISGDNSDNILTGTNNTDYIAGSGGNDTLNGGDGDDYLYDTSGMNIFNGGDGDDYLYGGYSADTFIIDNMNGVDTIASGFHHTRGDVIDISDLLTGYDSVTDAIEDFVSFTSRDGHAVISVDQDGGGDSFAEVVVIRGYDNYTNQLESLIGTNIIVE